MKNTLVTTLTLMQGELIYSQGGFCKISPSYQRNMTVYFRYIVTE